MRSPPYRSRALSAAAFLFIISLAACQTGQTTQRQFPPEQRNALQSGGPHRGTAETINVIFDYAYTVGDDQQMGRTIRIEGGIRRFKMKTDSLVLHINFLDNQGLALKRRLIYALGNRQGRDSFIRPSTSFATTLSVPDKTAYFAFSSRTSLSRGKR